MKGEWDFSRSEGLGPGGIGRAANIKTGCAGLGAFEVMREILTQLRNSVSSLTSSTKETDGLIAKC